jgi:hypothetical protein
MTFFLIEIERIIGEEFQGLTEQRFRVAASREAAEAWLQGQEFRHIFQTLWEREHRVGGFITIIQAVIVEVPGV